MVYVAADLAAQESDNTSLIDGVPVLVVEILSPNDTLAQTHEKINDYLQAGVALVWVIDPYDRTVTAYQPGRPDQTFQPTDVLTCPLIPGFAVPVARLFPES